MLQSQEIPIFVYNYTIKLYDPIPNDLATKYKIIKCITTPNIKSKQKTTTPNG